jgi:hypothetical protein
MQLKTVFVSRLLLVCGLLLITGMARAAPVNVLLSILPQQYFAERIGGKHVQVTVLLGPGRSPENYEPTLQQMTQAGRAKLFWRMGLARQNSPKCRDGVGKQGLRNDIECGGWGSQMGNSVRVSAGAPTGLTADARASATAIAPTPTSASDLQRAFAKVDQWRADKRAHLGFNDPGSVYVGGGTSGANGRNEEALLALVPPPKIEKEVRSATVRHLGKLGIATEPAQISGATAVRVMPGETELGRFVGFAERHNAYVTTADTRVQCKDPLIVATASAGLNGERRWIWLPRDVLVSGRPTPIAWHEVFHEVYGTATAAHGAEINPFDLTRQTAADARSAKTASAYVVCLGVDEMLAFAMQLALELKQLEARMRKLGRRWGRVPSSVLRSLADKLEVTSRQFSSKGVATPVHRLIREMRADLDRIGPFKKSGEKSGSVEWLRSREHPGDDPQIARLTLRDSPRVSMQFKIDDAPEVRLEVGSLIVYRALRSEVTRRVVSRAIASRDEALVWKLATANFRRFASSAALAGDVATELDRSYADASTLLHNAVNQINWARKWYPTVAAVKAPALAYWLAEIRAQIVATVRDYIPPVFLTETGL